MGAVKKYCNKAVLIENGLVKAIGSPENVANQYSFDNTAPLQHGEEATGDGQASSDEQVLVENFQLQLLSSNKLRPQDPIQFQIDFDVREDIQTYIALSLTDIDRNIWIYNDNSMNQLMTGAGHKRVHYTCSLPTVNDLKMKLEVTVRDAEGQMLAFSDATQTPLIFINRDDIDLDDKSAMDSASGLIQRNGTWSITD